MYNGYEEYSRDMYGCPYCRQDIYENSYRETQMCDVDNEEIKNCYPEIYKIVMPMVTSTCKMYSSRRITKEIVEEMTMKIYSNLEPQENRGTEENQRPLKNGDVVNPNVKRENREDRGGKNNYILKDLIKILLIKELTENNHNSGYKPQIPPPPPRPPQGPGGFYPLYDRPPQPRQF